MNSLKNKLLLGIVIIVSLLTFGSKVNANEVGFSVEPVLPKNQIEAKSGYFHLLMKQGATQKLQVKLKNTKTDKVELRAWVSSAKTNVNGVVDYSDNKSDVDVSLQHDLSKLVKIDENIVLPPKSEKTIDVEVTMPDVRLDGLLASGLTFEEKKDGETSQISSQTGIKNKFSYVIALLIQQEAEIFQTPELSIAEVKPKQLNAKSTISAEIRNVSSVFLNDMSVKVKITNKKTDKVILKVEKDNMQMAPNTIMDFPVFLNGEKLQAGDYLYEATVAGKGSGEKAEPQEWLLTTDFTVKKEEAKELNKTDTQLEDTQLSWWIWLLIIGNILLVVSVILFIIFKKIRFKNSKKKRRKKKKR